MGNRSLDKSVTQRLSDSKSERGAGARGRGSGSGGQVFEHRISIGPRRYSRLSVGFGVAWYSVYLETKKKLLGYAMYDGRIFTPCTIGAVISALEDESKNKSKGSKSGGKV